METHLPLFSSSFTTTLLLDRSNIQCSQFTPSSNKHNFSQRHDRTDISPRLQPIVPFIPHSSASWKLAQQLYSSPGTNSLATTVTPSTTDDHWLDVADHLNTMLDDDCWSLISASGKKTEIKGKIFGLPSLQLVSRYPTTRPVLKNHMAEKIRSWLPRRIITYQHQWKLLYSLDQHGASMHTFYQRVGDQGPCLLVIQDADDEIFGAFISESIKINNSFYGSGESFLWRCKQHQISDQQSDSLEHYPWTSKNSYFIYSDKTLIGFGNGCGRFGLCLDEGIENGTTSPCPTFDNPCLASSSHFICIGLEVWSVY